MAARMSERRRGALTHALSLAVQHYFTKGRFVVYDLETVGHRTEDLHIIEIGAVEGGAQYAEGRTFQRLLRFDPPGGNWAPYRNALEYTPLTEQDLASGAPRVQSLLEFMEFAGDSPLIAHSTHDKRALGAEVRRLLALTPANPPWAPALERWVRTRRAMSRDPERLEHLDSCALSQLLWPNLEQHKLGALCEKFNITNDNPHRALDDAIATKKLFGRILNTYIRRRRAASRGELHDPHPEPPR